MYKKRIQATTFILITLLICFISVIIFYVLCINAIFIKISQMNFYEDSIVVEGNTIILKGNLRGNIYIDKNIEKITLRVSSNEALSLEVDKNNLYYYSENNCIFDKETNVLILGCANSIIPKQTSLIGKNAFSYIKNSELMDLRFDGNIEDWLKVGVIYGSPAAYFKDVVFRDENNGFEKVTEISFNDTVESIPAYQFYNFSSLEKINFNNVKYIGDRAFAKCALEENFVIPNTILKIGQAAFASCKNVVNLTIPFVGKERSASEYSKLAYIFDYNLNSSNLEVPETIKKVTITDSTKIGDKAFLGCKHIEEVVLPSNIVSIGNSAFQYCDSLKEIILPESITSIGDYAFSSCKSLESIYIPNGIEILGDSIFYESNIKNVFYEEDFAHYLSVFQEDLTKGFECENLYVYVDGDYKAVDEYIVDSNVTKLDATNVKGLYFIKTLYFGKNVKEIEYFTFKYCTNLKRIYYDGKIEDWLNITFNDINFNPLNYDFDIYYKNNYNEYILMDKVVD